MRKKHKKDKNNGRNGWVGGNPRYNRNKKSKTPKDRTMGKN